MRKPPDTIWLQYHGDGDPDIDVELVDPQDVTWCEDKQYEHDIEYIRRDRIAADAYVLREAIIEEVKFQRNVAWDELREIRKLVDAKDDESTVDEVQRIKVQLDEIRRQLKITP
jgi:hypothetical protein